VARALIATGVALIVLTFLLAFTIYGELCAAAGIACVVVGAVKLGGRPPGK
jgi:hypothetical protein